MTRPKAFCEVCGEPIEVMSQQWEPPPGGRFCSRNCEGKAQADTVASE